MEMHITHTVSQSAVAGCPAAGCLVVVGALFELAEEGEVADSITELAKIFDHMKPHENVSDGSEVLNRATATHVLKDGAMPGAR
jgi:hypothetical protein